MNTVTSITVIGAGMVGTCCALHLQNEGLKVTLIDKDLPGDAASFGNLACFGIASCVPPGMPGILKKVPGMLMDKNAPLKMRWSHVPKALPWFLKFIANTRKERVEEIAKARQSLLDKVHETLDPLVSEAGAEKLMNKSGLIFTFESEDAFKGAEYAFDVRRRNGVEMDYLDGDQAREFEPALSHNVVRAIRIPNLVHTYNPGELVKSLARLFVARGGTLECAEVGGFETGADGVKALITEKGPIPVDAVVIAAGVWSRQLAKALGTSVPLEAERGYHTMFHDSDTKVNSAILSVDRYVSVTPMDYGVRVGGVAEFAPHDAPADWRYAKMLRRQGEALVPGLNGKEVTEWMGSRPSHPDSKAAIGRAPKHKNAYFAFGHDHLGLTMGSITGKLISEIVTNKTPSVELAPFRPDRF
ncbi:MAG: FAD-binding oxidoreductase [Rhodobacteraceae bacterium]|nr:FAD-binding oxidoreductase [Paracoccaceae bacterium]